MTSPLDLDAIEARAKAATPGKWSARSLRFADCHTEADAAHIAGLDPQTVLALVAEVRGLRERVEALEWALRDMLDEDDGGLAAIGARAALADAAKTGEAK